MKLVVRVSMGPKTISYRPKLLTNTLKWQGIEKHHKVHEFHYKNVKYSLLYILYTKYDLKLLLLNSYSLQL